MPERVKVVGAGAIVFVAARLAFWIGYRIDPLYRAAGFAGTAYLTRGAHRRRDLVCCGLSAA